MIKSYKKLYLRMNLILSKIVVISAEPVHRITKANIPAILNAVSTEYVIGRTTQEIAQFKDAGDSSGQSAQMPSLCYATVVHLLSNTTYLSTYSLCP